MPSVVLSIDFQELSRFALNFAGNLFVQTTFILTVGLFATWTVKRNGAAVQSCVLRATLFAVLLCPVASWLLQSAGVSGFRIDLIAASVGGNGADGNSASNHIKSANTKVMSRVESALESEAEVTHGKDSMMSHQDPLDIQSEELGTVNAYRVGSTASSAEIPSILDARISPLSTSSTDSMTGLSLLYTCVAGCWFFVSLILFLRLGVANMLMERTRRFATQASNEIISDCQSLAGMLRVNPPSVLVSKQITSPCLLGWLRPVILAPSSLSSISRDVMVHELTHLRRKDCLWNSLAHGIVALLPWQPLLWMVMRRMEETADEVCDDCVVMMNNSRQAYARELLDIAERFKPHWTTITAAAGIAPFRSVIGKRISRIMDTTRALSTRTSFVAFLLILTLGIGGTFGISLLGVPVQPSAVAADESALANTKLANDEASPKTISDGNTTPSSEVRTFAANQTDTAIESQKPREVVSTDNILSLRGLVSGPDGNPMRAQLWVGGPPRADEWSSKAQTIQWKRISQVGDDGKFEVQLDRAQWDSEIIANPKAKIRLAATADGFGYAWTDVQVDITMNDVALQLVKDFPIEGRILTADGQPATGVTVSINHVMAVKLKANESIDTNEISNGSGVYTNSPSWPGGGPTSKSVVTKNDGRFRMEGLGADRLIRLEAFGGGIAAARLGIYSFSAPRDAKPEGMIAAREGLAESNYFAKFTHIAVPGRVVRGVVTDSETGNPLDGVRVSVDASWASRSAPATTDKDGRYEIVGVPKVNNYRLLVESMNTLYFNKTLKIIDSPGLEPMNINTSLIKGIVARGRVTDSELGATVRGMVIYNPLYPNDNATKLGEQFEIANPASSVAINDDGSFQIPVLPGPGAIAVQINGERYLSANVEVDRLKEIIGEHQITEDVKKRGEVRFLRTAAGGQASGMMGVFQYQGVVLINPADDALVSVADFKVIPSRSRPGKILDDAGKPLLGVHVVGLGVSGLTTTLVPLSTAEFHVDGLAPGRKRTLLFLHPERKLGAKIEVSGDEMSPITAQLSPTGTVSGRFVNRFGQPLPIVRIELMPADPSLVGTGLWDAKVDDDGRFRITGLIKDSKYSLQAKIPAQRVSLYVREIEIESSNETIDLGEFTQQDEYRFMAFDRTGGIK